MVLLDQELQSLRNMGNECEAAADEIVRLRHLLGRAADKALTLADSYEMAVARLVLAMDYMHPEQKRAFTVAWTEKRREMKAVGLRA